MRFPPQALRQSALPWVRLSGGSCGCWWMWLPFVGFSTTRCLRAWIRWWGWGVWFGCRFRDGGWRGGWWKISSLRRMASRFVRLPRSPAWGRRLIWSTFRRGRLGVGPAGGPASCGRPRHRVSSVGCHVLLSRRHRLPPRRHRQSRQHRDRGAAGRARSWRVPPLAPKGGFRQRSTSWYGRRSPRGRLWFGSHRRWTPLLLWWPPSTSVPGLCQ